jgi:hypothetical protein
VSILERRAGGGELAQDTAGSEEAIQGLVSILATAVRSKNRNGRASFINQVVEVLCDPSRNVGLVFVKRNKGVASVDAHDETRVAATADRHHARRDQPCRHTKDHR